jgi:tetratricopeptide (TPR) repeat protein
VIPPRATFLALLAGAACAGAPPVPESAPVERATRAERPARSAAAAAEPRQQPPPAGAGSSQPKPPPDAISARAQRLFDDAVQSLEEQRKAKVPTDWGLLEKKWRLVLGAEEVAEARYNLGVALERQGRADEAAEEYRRALADKPGLRQAAVNLAVLREKSGDARGAAEDYARILRDFPEEALARERLSALYLQAGQTDEAWRMAREALLRDGRAIGAYKVLARIALQRNSVDLAKLITLRAEKVAERDAELAFLEGQILSRQGDDSGAADKYRKALSWDEEFIAARVALLAQAARAESWNQVVEQARAVLKQDPGNAAVRLALGIALRHLGKPEEALAAYAEAERLAGDRLPEVHLARGVLLMKVKSECEPAIGEFRAYARAAGAGLPADAPVFRLTRECEQLLEENRKAAEAAKEMQREAERKSAAEVPKKAAGGGPALEGGRPAPASAPSR